MRNLYIKQKVFKITDHYPVLDESGKVCYLVDQDFKFFGNTVHVSDPDGRHLFTVDKEILTFLPRFVVNFADGRSISLKSRFTVFRKIIDIGPDNLGLRLEGDFFNKDFGLFKAGNLLASIHKKWFTWGDTYELQVINNQFEELFLAVVIAVDCIIDNENSSN